MWRFSQALDNGNLTAELFAPKSGLGVGYYNPDFMKHFTPSVDADVLDAQRAQAKVFMTAESVEVSHRFIDGDSFLVEGDLGSGKSNVLNYIAWFARQKEVPYAFINLHNGLDATRFQKVATWALRREATLLVDSFDYIGAFADKTRSTAPARIAKRATAIIGILDGYLEEGGQLVGTTHTQPWLDRRVKNDEFRQWMAEMPVKRVWGLMDAVELRHTVRMIGPTDTYPMPQDLISELDTSADPHSKQYRVVKQLLVGGHSRLLDVDVRIEAINATTIQKMGAPEDYQLLPTN